MCTVSPSYGTNKKDLYTLVQPYMHNIDCIQFITITSLRHASVAIFFSGEHSRRPSNVSVRPKPSVYTTRTFGVRPEPSVYPTNLRRRPTTRTLGVRREPSVYYTNLRCTTRTFHCHFSVDTSVLAIMFVGYVRFEKDSIDTSSN